MFSRTGAQSRGAAECVEGDYKKLLLYFFFQDFIYLLSERGEGREKTSEKKHWCDINWLPLEHALTRDQTRNPGMYPDQELTHNFLVHGITLQPSHTSQAKHPLLAGAENVAEVWNVRDRRWGPRASGLEFWTPPEGCGVPLRVLSKG